MRRARPTTSEKSAKAVRQPPPKKPGAERTPRPPAPKPLSAADRRAQQAHRTFLEALEKTRGEGFIWLDD